MRLAYLFSRHPVVSQTFCDSEIAALRDHGLDPLVVSMHPPPNSLRHDHLDLRRGPTHYAPPSAISKALETRARRNGSWPQAMIARHLADYGAGTAPAARARNALYCADLFTRRDVRHFHVHFAGHAAHTALFIHQLTGIPFSVTPHSQDFQADQPSLGLLREILETAAFTVAPSRFSQNLLAQLAPAAAPRLLQNYVGIDISQFASRPPPDSPVPRIVSVGRLIEYKGFHHLIDACALLRDRGESFRCDIVGDGPWRERLQAQIDQLGLGELVTLTGHQTQEQVRRRLREADIFALHSIIDPHGASDMAPTVLMEAMATGRPAVSTRIVAIPEIVTHGENGWLVEPGDSTAFAECLAQLIRSPDQRRGFGDNARRHIETSFDAHHTASRLIPHFESSLGQTASRSAFSLADSPLNPPPINPAPRCPFAYLIGKYQVHHAHTRELLTELQALRQRWPDMPVFVISETTHLPVDTPDAEMNLLGSFEHLPHAVVIEAAWHRERLLAHRLEDALFDLNFSAIPSHEQFAAARLALALAPRLAAQGVRHLHTVGLAAHVTACVLRKADLVSSISALLEFPCPHGNLAARQIAGVCVGGRLTGKHTRQPLPHFLPAPATTQPPTATSPLPGLPAWCAQLESWTRGA